MRSVIVHACRLLLAATFVFSGFVKAVDPVGTQIKIVEYAAATGWVTRLPETVALALSVALSATEFTIGIALLFDIRRRVYATAAFLFMAVYTPLTVWIAVDNPVSDCGCFGDAVTLTNAQTLWKNIALLIAAAVVWRCPARSARLVGEGTAWIVIDYTVVFILIISGYALYYLPPFDFRPYHVGADIRQGMEMPEGASGPVYETVFIMEKDGTREVFSLDDYPDSTWTFIDSRTTVVKEGYVPPVHDFSIVTRDSGTDVTDSVLDRNGFTFLLVAPHVETADDSRLDRINAVHEYAEEKGIPFLCLTASSDKDIDRWRDITGAEYPFCVTDATTLVTMIRSNPGLILLNGSVVAAKWSRNNLPEESSLDGILDDVERHGTAHDALAAQTVKVIAGYVVPLCLLALADRLWAWSAWVRRRRKANKDKINKLLKRKKNMRKKIVAGNWKMNMTLQDGIKLAKELNDIVTADKPCCGVVICTPFIHLASIAQFLNQDIIGLGAENCADKEKGAYTGEVSAEMVKSTGANYVIIGHSERRGYYNETPDVLREKVLLAQKNGLTVIFCIGESLEEREAGKQNSVVKAELEGSLFNLSQEEFGKIVIAYEPIWAIGTGKTATAEQAEEIHAYIRSVIADKYGKQTADDTTILYGGSCKPSNAKELFAKPDIDGGLIGGASLKAADFKGIIDAFKK